MVGSPQAILEWSVESLSGVFLPGTWHTPMFDSRHRSFQMAAQAFSIIWLIEELINGNVEE